MKKSRLLEMVGKKRYFGGGTVEMNLIHSTHVVFKEEPEEVFEDGTINFQVMNIQPANYFYFVSQHDVFMRQLFISAPHMPIPNIACILPGHFGS